MVNNNNNTQATSEDMTILKEIENKKASFMDSLLIDSEELSLEDFDNNLVSRNKQGVHKEIVEFMAEDINRPIALNHLLVGMNKEGKTLTYKMIQAKGNLKDFKDYLVKTNAKVKTGDYMIKSIIKNNVLYLVKRARE